MIFRLPVYNEPDFQEARFRHAPDAATATVTQAGVAPDNFHATTIFPEYYKIDGCWRLLGQSRMDCVVVLRDDKRLEAKEFRRLAVGDRVTATVRPGRVHLFDTASGDRIAG